MSITPVASIPAISWRSEYRQSMHDVLDEFASSEISAGRVELPADLTSASALRYADTLRAIAASDFPRIGVAKRQEAVYLYDRKVYPHGPSASL